jgi:hypothetical protein
MPPGRDRHVLAVLLGIGLLLRLNPVTALLPLFDDEAFSYLVIQQPFPHGIIDCTACDVHPPLYYLLLAVWTSMAGTSPLAMRGLSVVLGTLIIPLSAWFGRLWIGCGSRVNRLATTNAASAERVTPHLLTAAVALSLPLVSISYLARMYALLTVVSILSAGWTIVCIREPHGHRPWTIMAICGTAACYTHNYGVLLVISLLIWILIEGALSHGVRSVLVSRALLVGGVVAIAYAPWLLILRGQMVQVSQSYWLPPLLFSSLPAVAIQLFTIPISEQPTLSLALSIAIVLAMGAAIWPWRRRSVDRLAMVVFGCHVVLLLMARFVMGLGRIPDKLVRHCIWAWLSILLMSSAGLAVTGILPLRDAAARAVEVVDTQIPRDAILLATERNLYVQMRYYLGRKGRRFARRLLVIRQPGESGHVPLDSVIPHEDHITLDELSHLKGQSLWAIRFQPGWLPSNLKEKNRFVIESLPNDFSERTIVIGECEIIRLSPTSTVGRQSVGVRMPQPPLSGRGDYGFQPAGCSCERLAHEKDSGRGEAEVVAGGAGAVRSQRKEGGRILLAAGRSGCQTHEGNRKKAYRRRSGLQGDARRTPTLLKERDSQVTSQSLEEGLHHKDARTEGHLPPKLTAILRPPLSLAA